MPIPLRRAAKPAALLSSWHDVKPLNFSGQISRKYRDAGRRAQRVRIVARPLALIANMAQAAILQSAKRLVRRAPTGLPIAVVEE